jgi:hypothetical protein
MLHYNLLPFFPMISIEQEDVFTNYFQRSYKVILRYTVYCKKEQFGLQESLK